MRPRHGLFSMFAIAALAIAPGASIAAAQTAPSRPPSSASSPSAAFVKLPSGVTLEYVVQGRAGGEVIVLLHGAGDSWHSYELVLPLLPDRYRVYAVTLRGHGLSDRPAEGYAPADFARDVTQLLTQLNLTRVTLVGHSLGSFAAQIVAEEDEGRLARLVLIGTSPGGVRDPNVRDEVRKAFESLTDPIDAGFARDFQSGTAVAPVPAWFLELMIGEAMRVPARVWRGIAAGVSSPASPDRLARIKVPTLVFWGERDAMMSKADQDLLVSKIAGAKLIAYPNTGHALHWERPQEFVRDLLAFMR